MFPASLIPYWGSWGPGSELSHVLIQLCCLPEEGDAPEISSSNPKNPMLLPETQLIPWETRAS